MYSENLSTIWFQSQLFLLLQPGEPQDFLRVCTRVSWRAKSSEYCFVIEFSFQDSTTIWHPVVLSSIFDSRSHLKLLLSGIVEQCVVNVAVCLVLFVSLVWLRYCKLSWALFDKFWCDEGALFFISRYINVMFGQVVSIFLVVAVVGVGVINLLLLFVDVIACCFA